MERLPPRPFISGRKRVRQAYDEFARPWRMIAAAGRFPVDMILRSHGTGCGLFLAIGVLPTALAERGRRVDGGAGFFGFSASICAPIWVMERGICAWWRSLPECS